MFRPLLLLAWPFLSRESWCRVKTCRAGRFWPIPPPFPAARIRVYLLRLCQRRFRRRWLRRHAYRTI